MKNTATKLAEFLNGGYKEMNVSKNSLAYNAINLLANDMHTETPGKVSTGHYSGSGRFTSARDFTNEVCAILDKIGVKYVTGNDSPRGGVSGKYVKITTRTFIAERKRIIAEYWEAETKRIAKEKAVAAMKAATDAAMKAQRNEWTYNKAKSLLDSFEYDWTKFKAEISNTRKMQKAAWWQLSLALGVANNEGLKKAVMESGLI